MLRGEFAVGELSPEQLHEAYRERLRETVDTLGAETVAARSGVDRSVVSALANGEAPELTLEAAAAILGSDPELPAGETVAADARDRLLMGMTTAVVDVDAVAAGLDIDREPTAVQQKVEGRHPMTLVEYAHVRAFLE
jgi:asparagine synthetase B (glutamine-hydrolysing)